MSTVACELNSSYYTTAIGNSALDGFSGNFETMVLCQNDQCYVNYEFLQYPRKVCLERS